MSKPPCAPGSSLRETLMEGGTDELLSVQSAERDSEPVLPGCTFEASGQPAELRHMAMHGDAVVRLLFACYYVA